MGGSRGSAVGLRKNKKPSGKSLQEGKGLLIYARISKRIYGRGKEVLGKRGFYHRPVYSEEGTRRKERRKRTIKVFNNVLFYLIPWFELRVL